MSSGDATESVNAVVESGDKKQAMEGHSKPVDSVDSKKIIVRAVKGTVKWFSLRDRFGFINRSDTGDDVFVHVSGIIHRGKVRYSLDPDQEVEMDVCVSPKGSKAIAVTLPGGYPIESTRIIRYGGRFGNRRRNNKTSDVDTAEDDAE